MLRYFTVYGDGSRRRDFTYMDDVTRGTVAAMATKGGSRELTWGMTGPCQ